VNWGRLRRWEFIPYWIFYIPVYFFVILLGIRHRSLTFFTAANPAFRLGGFVDYSKWEVQKLLPARLLPRTVLVRPGITETHRVLQEMNSQGLGFPVILKPDRGERGIGVQKICTPQELEASLKTLRAPMLVQEFLPESCEYGVLYMRRPDSPYGAVTSIVVKEPLRVVGDGRRTLGQLIRSDKRCRLHREMLFQTWNGTLDRILPAGEISVLSEIGNHVRGSTFLSGANLVTEELRESFDRVGSGIQGFFVGRFDVKADSAASLARGRFRIVELNGVNSEPAHIYHPGRSILLAYRDLAVHWYEIGRISAANMKAGHRPARLMELAVAIRSHRRMAGTLHVTDKG
jgi:hypothetical protein